MSMKRRNFLGVLGGAVAWPLAAWAQQPKKIPRIGVLYPGLTASALLRVAALREGLRNGGVAADEVEVVVLSAEGDPDRLARLAHELVEHNVDLLVPLSGLSLTALRTVVGIPIVAFDLETDPIGSGLVASLAHPGGNVTGVFFDFPEFGKKWLELLKEAVGTLSSVGVLQDPAAGLMQLSAVQAAAAQFNVRIEVIEVRGVADLDNAFLEAGQRKVGAVIMLSSPTFGTNPQRIANLALRHRLPAITAFPEFAREGGLMAYGANLLDGVRQTGGIAAKVLKGAKPAELPVELPTRFELVINLKTAKALGLTVPPTLLARADEVIE
jgi:putative tryptophan/tyrosine transport system substrate-binding protein